MFSQTAYRYTTNILCEIEEYRITFCLNSKIIKISFTVCNLLLIIQIVNKDIENS